MIDLPFALPTIVAGLTLLALYGPRGPLGVNIAYTRLAVLVALLFVTLPFVVRTVQPVLIELDREMEEAAASLGAGRLSIFARIIFPNLLPAILSGVALAFARAVGEFGAVVLISGNIPFDTEVVLGLHLRPDRERQRDGSRGRVGRPASRSRSWRCSGSAASGAGRRGTMASRYLLRFLAVGYVSALLLIPLAIVFKRAFERRARRSLGGGHDAGGEARVPADDPDRSDRGAVRTRSSGSSARSQSSGAASAGTGS